MYWQFQEASLEASDYILQPVLLCFLYYLPGKVQTLQCLRLFIFWHLFLFSPCALLLSSFSFSVRLSSCQCRWADWSAPRCNNTIYFHINRLTNVSSLADHVSAATFPVVGCDGACVCAHAFVGVVWEIDSLTDVPHWLSGRRRCGGGSDGRETRRSRTWGRLGAFAMWFCPPPACVMVYCTYVSIW